MISSVEKQVSDETSERVFEHIPLDLIDVVENIRFDDSDLHLEELEASIVQYGMQQPPLVTAMGDRYELVYGHRRVAAARKLGLAHIPCLVQTTNETPRCLLQLTENIQRQNLSPLEESVAIRDVQTWYKQRHGKCTQADLARLLGTRQPLISERLALLDLTAADRDRVHRGELSTRDALRKLAGSKPASLSQNDNTIDPTEPDASDTANDEVPQDDASDLFPNTLRELVFHDTEYDLQLVVLSRSKRKPSKKVLIAAVQHWLAHLGVSEQ